jgi:hypothetical protein
MPLGRLNDMTRCDGQPVSAQYQSDPEDLAAAGPRPVGWECTLLPLQGEGNRQTAHAVKPPTTAAWGPAPARKLPYLFTDRS